MKLKKISKHMTIVTLVCLISIFGISPAFITVDISGSTRKSLVVTFGNTNEVEASLKVFATSGLNYDYLAYGGRNTIFTEDYTDIFFIGHGSNGGILFQDLLIKYDDLINSNQGKYIYLIACHSYQQTANRVVSFEGKIDSVYGATYAITSYALSIGNFELAFKMLSVFAHRVIEINKNNTRPLYLDETEVGPHLSAKDQYITRKSSWGITYSWEHVLWINGANSYGWALIRALEAGAAAGIYWAKSIATLLLLPETLVVVLLIYTALYLGNEMVVHMGNRAKGDFMIGFGADTPSGTFHSWRDDGNDGHGSSWKGYHTMYLPAGLIGATALFAAIAPVSNSWVTLAT